RASSDAGLPVVKWPPLSGAVNSAPMNRPYSSWMETMSRDSGAGAYSQSALDRRSPPGSPAATGEAGLLTICGWPPHIAATLTYLAGPGAHRPAGPAAVPCPGGRAAGAPRLRLSRCPGAGSFRVVSFTRIRFVGSPVPLLPRHSRGPAERGGGVAGGRSAVTGNAEPKGIPDASRSDQQAHQISSDPVHGGSRGAGIGGG